jgi:dipeptidyl aminopeptidase/acylaminoacyl peptidase
MHARPRTSLAATLILLMASLTGAPCAARPFTANDLVLLSRLSQPRLAPDGHAVVFTLRETDLEANRGVQGLWRLDLAHEGAQPQRLTAAGSNASAARWAPDGRTLYFLSNRSGSTQVWRLDEGLGEARPVTHLPVDVGSFRVSPDGRRLLLAADVFLDCADLACTRDRLAAKAAAKATGVVYESLFVRHWDAWSDGRRSQLFVADLARDGDVHGEPRLLTKGIGGDVPSKPFGDESEYVFSPDGATVYFDARIAGRDEAWSTNFDVYAVAADGRSPPRNLTADNAAWDGYPLASANGKYLYYLAMRRPAHEADRFAIVELDLATGRRREVAPNWDRSAGPLKLARDGRTLYTTADNRGEHPLFAVDVASGTVRRVVGNGDVTDFEVGRDGIVFARGSLTSPVDLYRLAHGAEKRLSSVNAERLRDVVFGEVTSFEFPGWNGELVHGYVVKPFGFEAGRRYPVAFLIHGGPQGSWLNEFHYRWNPQTYAGAGYAVVAIDFHGSTGYGQSFTDAISEHWGDRPLEDLQKGWAAALARFPFLAADRACALGASYGGYMINWIAGNWHTPESGAWRCLVSHDGVFDSRGMYYATEELWFDETEHGGTPWQRPESFERFNPANHVADWRVPMLVIHGALDYRVTLEQGLGAFTALQRRGIPSEFLHFPDENHWVLKPQNSLRWHETVEAWLRRWTAP